MVKIATSIPPKEGIAIGTMISDPRPSEVSTGISAISVVSTEENCRYSSADHKAPAAPVPTHGADDERQAIKQQMQAIKSAFARVEDAILKDHSATCV